MEGVEGDADAVDSQRLCLETADLVGREAWPEDIDRLRKYLGVQIYGIWAEYKWSNGLDAEQESVQRV